MTGWTWDDLPALDETPGIVSSSAAVAPMHVAQETAAALIPLRQGIRNGGPVGTGPHRCTSVRSANGQPAVEQVSPGA